MKIFRNIRFSLFNNKGVGSYLIYALLEIILVVIGILIAIRVNNWNDQRKTRNLVEASLSNLNYELIANSEQLNVKILTCDSILHHDSILLSQVNPVSDDRSEKNLGLSLEKMANYTTFDPLDGVIKNLIQTGLISHIESVELQIFLSSWDGYIRDIKDMESYPIDHSINVIRPFIRDKYSIRNIYTNNVGFSPFEWNPEGILSNPEFENILVRSIFHQTLLLDRYHTFTKIIDRMIILTQEELD